MGQQVIVTGARVFLYLNGKKFGRVTSFSYTVSTPHREIEGIDNMLPSELAPTRQRVQFQIGLIRLAMDGAAEGAGMVPRGDELSRGKYFTIGLVERLTDTVIFQSNYCSLDSQAWGVNAKGRLEGQVVGKCISYANEVGPTKEGIPSLLPSKF